MKRTLAIIVILILILNLVLFALKKVSITVFWIIIALGALYLWLTKKWNK